MGKCVSQICYHDANGEREVIMRYPKIGIRPVIDGPVSYTHLTLPTSDLV